VCTTEIGRLALKYKELESKGVKLATLSCDPVTSHQKWLEDVVAHCENKVRAPVDRVQPEVHSSDVQTKEGRHVLLSIKLTA
jgi:alkyl hydroperoxide reductase subunit AhpC